MWAQLGGHVWSITIELPFVLANKWCGAKLLRANPVPLLEAFVRVFAPAAIGVRTVGFVERGTLGEFCQAGKCW